jgi:hypothetical protein
MVPVEQFLDRYVFVTGIGYNLQLRAGRARQGRRRREGRRGGRSTATTRSARTRSPTGRSTEGSHLAESDAPFGIYQVGYTGVTSYAYPGGLRLKVINPQ